MILVLSASLALRSRSRLLAAAAHRHLDAAGRAAAMLDLRDFPLPLCDGDAAYAHPHVATLAAAVRAADAVLVATPVYNYDANAALKNLIELTGGAWKGKVVGFLCAAGGANSYMSILPLANSLMLDFRCVIVPRFVYATGEAFADDGVADPEIARRVAELADAAAHLGQALKAA